jgi:hypothetical protein
MTEAADVQLRLMEEHPRSRRTLWRMALTYSPAAIVALALAGMALYNLVTGSIGAVVGVILLTPIALALTYQAVTALRDLIARPVRTRGSVARLWDKGTVLWMSRSYYTLLEAPKTTDPSKFDRHVFVISQLSALDLRDGMVVEAEHWPHTNTLVRLWAVERQAAPRREESGPRGPRRPTR